MKKRKHYQHPMLVNAQKIKENGIVIFDDVRGLPSGKEPFTSPDYVIMHLVGVMRETANIDISNRQHFMMSQLEFFMRLLSHYRSVRMNETLVEQRVSTLFSNDLAQHFRAHRDVEFYAGKVCLSTKHFSVVVKQETGHTPAWWIRSQVTSEAKKLLGMRPDLNVQTIADMLGFDNQATFSRFFKRETGLSPTEYRMSV